MKEKNFPPSRVSPQQKIALVFLGLILSLVLLEAGMRLGGFVLLSIQEYSNLQSIKQKGAYRILCLGESTTQREFPKPLERILNQHPTGVRFSVIDKGLGGTTTSAILSNVESYLAEYHPDMVVAMMGINDSGVHMPLEARTISKGTLFVRSFRVYKLMRLLWLHLQTKAKAMGFCELAYAQPVSVKAETTQPEAEQKKTSTEAMSDEGSPAKAGKPNSESDYAYLALGQISLKQEKFAQAEYFFKKATEINPKNDKAYGELGRVYRIQKKFVQAKDSLIKSIELNPQNDWICGELGQLYREQGELSQAKDAFKKAVELNPNNGGAYFNLGQLYREQGEISQAEDAFKRAIEINPKNKGAFTDLALIYRMQRRGDRQVEDIFWKAIELNPENDAVYVNLGIFYKERGKLQQAEALVEKALRINPKNNMVYLILGWLYREQGALSRAEDIFHKGLAVYPGDAFLLLAMASLYEEMNKPELAKEYAEKANKLSSENYPVTTVNNYRKLKEILDRRGIRLVCVQYPMRNVELLKSIFTKDEGVIFVDNESLFKEAVKRSNYKEYFRDMFAGDFGHCTQKGNELLAQNIADVILREVFHK